MLIYLTSDANGAFVTFWHVFYYRFCEYFPEEFSILATFKVTEDEESLDSDQKGKLEQGLFVLKPLASTAVKLAIRLYRYIKYSVFKDTSYVWGKKQ